MSESILSAQKQCSKCKSIKLLSSFGLNKRNEDGLQYVCKPCSRLYDRQRYKTKGRANRQNQRDYLLAKRFGISREEFDLMLTRQNGGCAICNTKSPRGRWSTFHVDHDHETGRVRGLLCHGCNVALGQFGDNLQGVMRAVSYLKGGAMSKAIAIVLAFLVLCASARADFPIIEVGWAQPSAIELPAIYVFEMKGWYWGGFLNQYPPGQHPGYVTSYPVVQWADQTSIDQWNADPAHSIYSVAIAQGGQQPNGQFGGQFLIDYAVGGQNKLWVDGWSDGAPTAKFGTYIGTAFATQKGLGGLEGYRITRVERTITALSQVVKIYGEDFEFVPIAPEPGLFPIMLVAIGAILLQPKRSR